MADDQLGRSEWLRSALQEFEEPLVRYATRLTGDLEQGRDVVQDTFLRLMEADRDRVSGHLAEWLFTVCRNRSLDVLRKERRMTSMTDERTESMETSEKAAPGTAAGGDGAEDALCHLARLPERQQEVLRLKFQNGLSYKEISRVTELSVSNVGFLIHTGLKSLRAKLTLQPIQNPSTAR